MVWELLVLLEGISFLQKFYANMNNCYLSLTLFYFITGLAAPAVAQGLGALAPTLGSVVPAIGASGFAAAASATGSVAGSAAVAASFGGT